jgi:hypothetical protein
MSYQLISETTPRARKEYKCIWCGEQILRGEKHTHEVSTFDGFQDHRWHMECYKASKRYFAQSGEEEFMPYDYRRGSLESKWEIVLGGKLSTTK